MSVMPLIIARKLNKHPRTIRRWCELGLIPGAYRTKGGHWRIRRFRIHEQLRVSECIEKFARHRGSFPEDYLPPFDKELLEWLKDGGQKRYKRATRLLLATHGLSNETFLTERLTDEQSRILDHTPIDTAITPEMRRAGKLPHSDLHVAARAILSRSASGKVTARALAAELKVSRMTLYRKPYGKDALRAVINFTMRQTGKAPLERQQQNGEDDIRRRKLTALNANNREHFNRSLRMTVDAEKAIHLWYRQCNSTTRKKLERLYPALRLASKVTAQASNTRRRRRV
jgi:AcrR family transcriptional regulator